MSKAYYVKRALELEAALADLLALYPDDDEYRLVQGGFSPEEARAVAAASRRLFAFKEPRPCAENERLRAIVRRLVTNMEMM